MAQCMQQTNSGKISFILSEKTQIWIPSWVLCIHPHIRELSNLSIVGTL